MVSLKRVRELVARIETLEKEVRELRRKVQHLTPQGGMAAMIHAEKKLSLLKEQKEHAHTMKLRSHAKMMGREHGGEDEFRHWKQEEERLDEKIRSMADEL